MTTSEKQCVSADIIGMETRMQALLSCAPSKLSRLDAVLFGSPPEPDEVSHPPVTITKAASLLGKSRSTLHRWIKTGVIDVVEIPGGNPLVPHREITRLAGRREVK